MRNYSLIFSFYQGFFDADGAEQIGKMYE